MSTLPYSTILPQRASHSASRLKRRLIGGLPKILDRPWLVFGAASRPCSALHQKLVYRISLLSACLLAERGDARKARFEEVKRLYGLRSKVVHGEQLPQERVMSALNDSYRLLTDLLLLSIEKGHVLGQEDFDQAVFH